MTARTYEIFLANNPKIEVRSPQTRTPGKFHLNSRANPRFRAESRTQTMLLPFYTKLTYTSRYLGLIDSVLPQPLIR